MKGNMEMHTGQVDARGKGMATNKSTQHQKSTVTFENAIMMSHMLYDTLRNKRKALKSAT